MIFNSFSGGRTSALMTIWLNEQFPKTEVTHVFMNTGMEAEETYRFIKQLVDYLGIELNIIESKVIHKYYKGTTFKKVKFNEMHKGINLMKEIVKKYGLFGPGYLHCTRELKQQPFEAFRRSLGFNSFNSLVALGIRSDEMDRVSEYYIEKNYYYPLLNMNIRKEDILSFWKDMPFDLELPEHLGNCVGCWKKSSKKLAMVANERPYYLRELKKLEKIDKQRPLNKLQVRRCMFRDYKTVNDILNSKHKYNFTSDNDSLGCQESCEVF
jgi:hypothetical protein